jgi:putative phage-type endonuclease
MENIENTEVIETKPQLKFYFDHELVKQPVSKLKYLRDQVAYLRSLPQPEQRSEAWYKMREGRITASDVGTILGYCDYADRESVLLKKVDTNAKFMKSAAMEHGIKHERNAIQIYEKRNNQPLIDFGLLPHETISILACSPDSISEDGVMVEIKCPSSRQITGIPPKYYWAQCQIQLECCGLDRCDFLECSIKEIDEEEYMTSNLNGDFTLFNNGNEKGLVAEFFDLTEKSFMYEHSPLCLYGEELENWKTMIQQKHANNPKYYFASFSYWYLECVSCIPIYRNSEWFFSILPQLEEFWSDVVKYRQAGIEILKEDIKAIKEKRKQERELEKLKAKEAKESLMTQPSKKTTTYKKQNDRDIQQYLYAVEKKPKKEYVAKSMYDDKIEDLPQGFLFSNNNEEEAQSLKESKTFGDNQVVEEKKTRKLKKKETISLFS